MSLFGIEAPARLLPAKIHEIDDQIFDEPEVISEAVRQDRLRGAKLFEGLVAASFLDKAVEVEHIQIAGMPMVLKSFSNEEVIHVDGHGYTVTAGLQHPQNNLTSVAAIINIAQRSPNGESDGFLQYELLPGSSEVTRQYLGPGPLTSTLEEYDYFTRLEVSMAEKVPMPYMTIHGLGRSLMELYGDA